MKKAKIEPNGEVNTNEPSIGVIGTGIMGADHVKTITTAISGAEVRAVADIDLKRSETIASSLPRARALASAQDLIAAPEVDAVIIASSDASHAQYIIACLAARKPVLCEKPLAPLVAECEHFNAGASSRRGSWRCSWDGPEKSLSTPKNQCSLGFQPVFFAPPSDVFQLSDVPPSPSCL